MDQILVTLPEETEELYIQNGKDLVTLYTCTPYGINTHRLLVRGYRVTEPEE
ncbi:sortase [Clostridium sp. AF12-19]|nr:sortase [Clostridium sp. AF12-19]RHS22680.1 sortase [Clostridium sp. AF12-28]